MPTGQTIISNALTILGILEQGGSPSASDSTAALNELNAMWDAWGIDEGLIYSILTATKVLTGAVASYTIGTGGAFNTQRPSRIYEAFMTTANGRVRLEIVDALRYYAHRDLAAAAVCSDELYPDYNVDASGFAKLYLWPVPSGTPTLEIEVGVPFTAWTLAGVYQLPYGYQDAIQYALAWRLIPQYGGIVAPQVMQTVELLGAKAELRIRTANSKDRQIPGEMAALEPLGAPQAAPPVPGR
jgi:hypothetical protein